MRSTMISRCSSPIPEMTVWPVSSSVRTRNVGSSSASFWRAMPILSCSALVFGSTATEMTGSGNVICSRTIGYFSSQSVSPVVVLRRPMAGANLLDLLAVVRVHLEQAADALALTLGGVVDVGAAAQHAAVDAEERELADEGIGGDLERQRRERLAVARV